MPTQSNRSLIDGLRCLQMLVANRRPVGSREMAQRLGLEHTRVNRLLRTLAVLGLSEQTPDRKYRPGPGIHVLAAQSLQGSQLLSCALPHLERVRGPDLTVALGVLWQGYVCFLCHARPGMRMEEAIGTHELEPVGNSSIGVLMLSDREDWEEEAARAQDGPPKDPEMPREPLAQSVAAARRNGYARLDFPSGDVSLAVAVGAPPVAGIALAGMLDEERIPVIVEELRRTAALVSAELEEVFREARRRGKA